MAEIHEYNKWFLASDRVLTIQPYDHSESLPCAIFALPLPSAYIDERLVDLQYLNNDEDAPEDMNETKLCLRAELNPTDEASNVYDIPDNCALYIASPEGSPLWDLIDENKHFVAHWSKR